MGFMGFKGIFVFLVFCRTCLGVECFGAFHVVKGFCFSDLAKKLAGFSWD